MANTVVGVFANDSDLGDAVSELLVSGFLREQLHPFSPRAAGSSDAMHAGRAGNEPGYERPEDASRLFGNALAEYGEYDVYDDLLGRGHFILAVHADSEERVDRAVEVMSRHSPVDINEYQTTAEEEAPKGMTDTAVVPEMPAEAVNSSFRESKSARRSGKIRIF